MVRSLSEHLFDPDLEATESVEREFRASTLHGVANGTVVGLFAGIGGVESGLARAGLRTELLCEVWEPARAVLSERFPDVALAGDIRDVRSLPKVDVVTAGFPCTDLSQAGRTRGIRGKESGLVAEVFRLLGRRRAPVLVLENVRNMLVLDGGRAMRFLVDEIEALGYRWAYRLVDSRFTGVPQRRQRVIFVAARDLDPRTVVLADDAGPRDDESYADEAFGFYWTEGLRGLGWARDAVPTLKGGSTIGIPSPPGIWNLSGAPGRRILVPRITDAERLQGFDPGWARAADRVSSRKGTRWKLVGNAVTVGVAAWLGDRLVNPGEPILDGRPLANGTPWPTAAWGAGGKVFASSVSMWPRRGRYRHLRQVVDLAGAEPLSVRGAAGFLERANRGSLNFVPGFLDDVFEHIEHLRGAPAVA
jgi:DNA (cytosine-5)-methyltransferase 1